MTEMWVSQQLMGAVGEGLGLYLQMSVFEHFPMLYFFGLEITLHFVYLNIFFYIVCVLYVLKTVNFVFVIQHTQFFCLGICLNTGIENFYKNKIPKIFLKDIFRLFQTPCLSFIDQKTNVKDSPN